MDLSILGGGLVEHRGGGNEVRGCSVSKEVHEDNEDKGKQERVGRVHNPKDMIHGRYAGLVRAGWGARDEHEGSEAPKNERRSRRPGSLFNYRQGKGRRRSTRRE